MSSRVNLTEAYLYQESYEKLVIANLAMSLIYALCAGIIFLVFFCRIAFYHLDVFKKVQKKITYLFLGMYFLIVLFCVANVGLSGKLLNDQIAEEKTNAFIRHIGNISLILLVVLVFVLSMFYLFFYYSLCKKETRKWSVPFATLFLNVMGIAVVLPLKSIMAFNSN